MWLANTPSGIVFVSDIDKKCKISLKDRLVSFGPFQSLHFSLARQAASRINVWTTQHSTTTKWCKILTTRLSERSLRITLAIQSYH